MKEGWAKIKAAFDDLSKMMADYDSEEMAEEESGEEDSESPDTGDQNAGMGGKDTQDMFSGDTGGKKVNKVSIASAIIKKKMGL